MVASRRQVFAVFAAVSLTTACHTVATAAEEEASFTSLGFLNPAQPFSSAWSVSDDGTRVALTSFQDGDRGALWTPGGLVNLNPLPDIQRSTAGFVSADGTIVTGRSILGCCITRSTRWAAPNFAPEYLGPNLAGGEVLSCPVSNCHDHVLGMSGDGQVVVGQSGTGLDDAGSYHPYRWTEATGMESLVDEAEAETTFGAAIDASHDGSVIVGWYRSAGNSEMRAFRWTEQTGAVFLGTLGGNSEARAVSPDGNIVVGDSSVIGAGRTAFRWTEKTGMVSLGNVVHNGQPHSTVPLDLTADGSTIVGYWMLFQGTCPQCWHDYIAFIWDEENGFRDLVDVLQQDYDLNLSGWSLTEARAISPDGRFIVGEGINPLGQTEGWLVDLAPGTPPTCPADLTGDDNVDVFDLLALLAQWGPCQTADQCEGQCFDQAPTGCWCDDSCFAIGDCCAGACNYCPLGYCDECPGDPNCPPSFVTCSADLDDNSAVDVFDLLELLAGWGSCGQ